MYGLLVKLFLFYFPPFKNKYPALPIYMNRVQIYTQAGTLSCTELLLNVTVKEDNGQKKFLQIMRLYLHGVFAQPVSKLDLCAK